MQSVSFGELHASYSFQDVKHNVPCNFSVSDLLFTVVAWLKHQVVRFDGIPEPIVVHRF